MIIRHHGRKSPYFMSNETSGKSFPMKFRVYFNLCTQEYEFQEGIIFKRRFSMIELKEMLNELIKLNKEVKTNGNK